MEGLEVPLKWEFKPTTFCILGSISNTCTCTGNSYCWQLDSALQPKTVLWNMWTELVKDLYAGRIGITCGHTIAQCSAARDRGRSSQKLVTMYMYIVHVTGSAKIDHFAQISEIELLLYTYM